MQAGGRLPMVDVRQRIAKKNNNLSKFADDTKGFLSMKNVLAGASSLSSN